MYDFLVVGAGISGVTLARILAEEGRKVLLIDRRDHIGGNCYDFYNTDGILIHKYGPHIFHTKHKAVWDFLSGFTEWRLYQHRVKAFIDGRYVTFPINLKTIRELYNKDLSPSEMRDFLDSRRVPVKNPSNAREAVISQVGEELFGKFFEKYTEKQWGMPADRLSPLVTQRIPVRFSSDDRYFDDPYQGVPLNGYTGMFGNMLNHKNIHVMLQADFRDLPSGIKFGCLVYTGPVDEYFGFQYGKLQYRSIDFDFRTYDMESYQDVAVVNYPNDYDFTRITEYKKLTGQKAGRTVVSFEYPTSDGDPCYPVPLEENHEMRDRYIKRCKRLKSVFFAGRLGTYRYLNMDIACLEAMSLAKKLIG